MTVTTEEQETTNDLERTIEENLERYDMTRFDSHNPNYHLHSADFNLFKQQYEVALKDPRRI